MTSQAPAPASASPEPAPSAPVFSSPEPAPSFVSTKSTFSSLASALHLPLLPKHDRKADKPLSKAAAKKESKKASSKPSKPAAEKTQTDRVEEVMRQYPQYFSKAWGGA